MKLELDDPSFKYGDHLLNDFLCVCQMMGALPCTQKITQLPNVIFLFQNFSTVKYLCLNLSCDAIFITCQRHLFLGK